MEVIETDLEKPEVILSKWGIIKFPLRYHVMISEIGAKPGDEIALTNDSHLRRAYLGMYT